MTGTSARNNYGIFKTKKTYLFASRYGLELYNKNAYIRSGKFVSFDDVQFIVDNLWLDYYLNLTDVCPIDNITTDEEYDIFISLKNKFPFFEQNYSIA